MGHPALGASGASDHTAGGPVDASANRLDQTLSRLFTRDTRTNRPVLSISLPESVTQERTVGAVSALLNKLR
jgi:hypothetical protein